MKNVLIILGVLTVGGIIIYLVVSNSKTTNIAANTNAGTGFNPITGQYNNGSNYVGTGQSATSTNLNDPNAIVNGMTREQYMAAGYSQADINLLFS